MKNEVIETTSARVWLGEDGILRIVTLPDVKVTLETITEVNRHMKKLCRGKKVPVFTDIRGVKSITREARLFASGEDSAQVGSAAALLIGSPVSKVIGNFFLGINKPPFPTKLFNSEKKALQWLKGFVEREESDHSLIS
jgi:hypothetical protein